MTARLDNRKTAIVTGVFGQDGVYLSELLLAKGYRVHGATRNSAPEREPAHRLLSDAAFSSHAVDIGDREAVADIIHSVRPDELYNLAAQSSVPASFEDPATSFRTNSAGVSNLIETILALPVRSRPRLFQASTAEIFGSVHDKRIDETTPRSPANPYGESKREAHDAVIAARRDHGLHASNGILFNHESPLRGETFVTRKITRAVAAIHLGRRNVLTLGNLDARRDWGHAREYVEAMWRMLQQERADDYILATGVTASTREFVVEAFARIGVDLAWRGEGVDERGVCAKTGEIRVEISADLFRPEAASPRVIDTSKAKASLGWSARTTWRAVCAEMVAADLADLARTAT